MQVAQYLYDQELFRRHPDLHLFWSRLTDLKENSTKRGFSQPYPRRCPQGTCLARCQSFFDRLIALASDLWVKTCGLYKIGLCGAFDDNSLLCAVKINKHTKSWSRLIGSSTFWFILFWKNLAVLALSKLGHHIDALDISLPRVAVRSSFKTIAVTLWAFSLVAAMRSIGCALLCHDS